MWSTKAVHCGNYLFFLLWSNVIKDGTETRTICSILRRKFRRVKSTLKTFKYFGSHVFILFPWFQCCLSIAKGLLGGKLYWRFVLGETSSKQKERRLWRWIMAVWSWLTSPSSYNQSLHFQWGSYVNGGHWKGILCLTVRFRKRKSQSPSPLSIWL